MLLKALKHIITLAVVLLAIATAFAAWSVRIPPAEAGKMCLVWFAFPYLWLLTAAVGVVCFAFRGWFQFFVCLAVCAATWGSARLVVDVPSGGNGDIGEGGIKILTYNVHYMGYANEMTPAHSRDSICQFLLSSDAGIICLQEAPLTLLANDNASAHDLVAALSDKYPYKQNLTGADASLGQIILSKYKMKDATGTRAKFDKAERRGAIVAADILIGKDTLRVINCHLASLALSDSEINAVSGERSITTEREKKLRVTYGKMSKAFTARQKEVDILKDVLESTSLRVIVCGDFNDTPVSYTYHTLTTEPNALTDTRTPHGIGLANTYRGNLPPLRIDYVLTSPGVRASGYAEHDLPTSDHKAVSVSFSL